MKLLEPVEVHFPGEFYIHEQDLPKGHVSLTHKHRVIHATCIMRGRVRLTYGDGAQEFGEGEWILIRPHTHHAFLALEDSRIACVFHNRDLLSDPEAVMKLEV